MHTQYCFHPVLICFFLWFTTALLAHPEHADIHSLTKWLLCEDYRRLLSLMRSLIIPSMTPGFTYSPKSLDWCYGLLNIVI